MKTSIAVPAGAAYFEGHFPGRPILPGVVEMLLVVEALARAWQRPVALRGIAFARLRQLVLPGEQLELEWRELDDGRVRVDLTRQGSAVANAELILGPPAQRAQPASLDAAARLPVPAPPLDALLPHRPPMRFVTAILGQTEQGLDCTACVPAECGLASAGLVPALAAVEAAAQTAAAWEAVRRWRDGNPAEPRVGYLVALRDVVFFAEHIAAGQSFAACVRLEAAAPPLTHYRFEAALNGSLVASGMIATFLAA
ncbi:MAG: hypothetical protein ABI619_00425 [Betaproteobacteria bacterium]